MGWCPEDNREIFSLEELVKEFSVKRISKSPAVFDYKKLDWFNGEYIKSKTPEQFEELSKPYISKAVRDESKFKKISELLQGRISKLSEIPQMIDFFEELPDYDVELFKNKKSKTTVESSLQTLEIGLEKLNDLSVWNHDSIHDLLINMAVEAGVKNGAVMWPIRIAVSGKAMTPGGAIEILEILGKEESIKRISGAIDKIKNC